MPPRSPARLALLAPALLLQGCLSTWVRLEDGTVLPPGRTEYALAFAKVPRVERVCPEPSSNWAGERDPLCLGAFEEAWIDSSGISRGSWHYDTVPSQLRHTMEPHAALVWRLGLLPPFGPFTGLDLGLQTEVATAPVSQEFRLGLGLPTRDTLFAHELLAGWGIGMWSDNSWFLQYAASRRFGRARLFGSVRATRQATQGNDVFQDDSLARDPSWDLQWTAGARLSLGKAILLPDWLLAAATLNSTSEGMPRVGDPPIPGWSIAATTAMGWSW